MNEPEATSRSLIQMHEKWCYAEMRAAAVDVPSEAGKGVQLLALADELMDLMGHPLAGISIPEEVGVEGKLGKS